MNSNALHLDEKQKPRTIANKMSVYTYPYRWRSWRGFWGNIRAWFDNKGAAKQRAKRGYCIGDVWNAGNSIVDYIINVLCEYRNRTMAWPDQYFTTFEEWIAYIDEIIDLFDYSRRDTDEINELYEEYSKLIHTAKGEYTEEQKEFIERFFKREAEIYEEQVSHRKVAFAKLAAHIDHIWY